MRIRCRSTCCPAVIVLFAWITAFLDEIIDDVDTFGGVQFGARENMYGRVALVGDGIQLRSITLKLLYDFELRLRFREKVTQQGFVFVG